MMRAVSWKIWIYLYVYPQKSLSLYNCHFNLNATNSQRTFSFFCNISVLLYTMKYLQKLP